MDPKNLKSPKIIESNLWKWLSKARSAGEGLRLTRIENLVEKGTPDVSGTFDGADFWIELKTAERPAKASTAIKPYIRPEQLSWLIAHKKAGGRGAILLQIGSGTAATKLVFTEIRAFYRLQEDLTEDCLKLLSHEVSIHSPLEVIQHVCQ